MTRLPSRVIPSNSLGDNSISEPPDSERYQETFAGGRLEGTSQSRTTAPFSFTVLDVGMGEADGELMSVQKKKEKKGPS